MLIQKPFASSRYKSTCSNIQRKARSLFFNRQVVRVEYSRAAIGPILHVLTNCTQTIPSAYKKYTKVISQINLHSGSVWDNTSRKRIHGAWPAPALALVGTWIGKSTTCNICNPLWFESLVKWTQCGNKKLNGNQIQDDWNPWKKHALFSFVIFGMGFFVVVNLGVDCKCKRYLAGTPFTCDCMVPTHTHTTTATSNTSATATSKISAGPTP